MAISLLCSLVAPALMSAEFNTIVAAEDGVQMTS